MEWLEREINKCMFFDFLFKNSKKLAIFGAGKTALEFVRYIQSRNIDGIKIIYIIDNDIRKVGSFLSNVPVISYMDFCKEHRSDVKVLLAGRKIYQLYQDALRSGVSDEDIWFPRSSYVWKESFMSIDWIIGCPVYTRMLDIYYERDRIAKAYALLDDEKSREVFEAVIRFRLTLDPVGITKCCECANSDYFRSAPFTLSHEETFVDIGALRGDSTLEFLYCCNNQYDHIYVMEPDEIGLCKAMDSIFTVDNMGKISYCHLAISDFCGLASFDGSVLGTGGKVVRSMTLDSLMKNKKITLIKMDIEGQERNALNGASNLIKKQKPKLCVCVYHISNDLWELPIIMKEMNKDYKICMRQNSPGVHGDIQTVCYAY